MKLEIMSKNIKINYKLSDYYGAKFYPINFQYTEADKGSNETGHPLPIM